MSVLAPEVSRRKFQALVDRLRIHAKECEAPWRVVSQGYPFIGVHVFDTKGNPKWGLRLDASEWPHRPLGVMPTELNFKKKLNPARIPQAEAVEGGFHIYRNARGESWFCTEGTMDFHDAYPDDLPWEAVRSNENMKPERIVSRCVQFIDRTSA